MQRDKCAFDEGCMPSPTTTSHHSILAKHRNDMVTEKLRDCGMTTRESVATLHRKDRDTNLTFVVIMLIA